MGLGLFIEGVLFTVSPDKPTKIAGFVFLAVGFCLFAAAVMVMCCCGQENRNHTDEWVGQALSEGGAHETIPLTSVSS